MNRPVPAALYHWEYSGGAVELAASPAGLLSFRPAVAVCSYPHWGERSERYDPANCGYGLAEATDLLDKAFRQLAEYLAGARRDFTLPYELHGSEWDLRVWRALLRIPYGTTATYGEIATALGNPRAARAVAGACGRNPLPVFVPCHRVVASAGLGGYSDPGGLHTKEFLLRLEGAL